MTQAIEEVLRKFDQLKETEQQEAVYEILKRISKHETTPLTEEEMVLSAEELFLELDKREAASGSI
jgi:Fe2+ or Zn2+ uptake regulation protein